MADPATLFGLGIIAVPIILIVAKVSQVLRTVSSTPQPDQFVELKGGGDFDIAAVGESHYQAQLASIVHPRDGYVEYVREAILRCENDNPYDNQAVAVTMDKHTVGYLGKADARRYRAIIARMGFAEVNGRCQAKVCGGGKAKPNYGVWIDI
jgi:hypothetical protein